nr:2-hydroxyisoflavanone dehydratase [Quercus suber]
MTSTTKEVATEILLYIRVYKDGSVFTAHNQNQKLPILVYFHGGGFFFESTFSSLYHRYLSNFVSQVHVLAISVEYRLAPEHLLPAAYEDCWAALQWVATQSAGNDKEHWLISNGDFERIFIGGDSAGGDIVHNMAMRARVESLTYGVKILGAVVEHPYFWSSKPIGSESKEGHNKSQQCLVWNFVYPSATGVVNPEGPGAPSLAGLGCNRMLVRVAGNDQLRDRGIWYVDMARKSGWKGEVELFEVDGEDHVFHIHNIENTSDISQSALFDSPLTTHSDYVITQSIPDPNLPILPSNSILHSPLPDDSLSASCDLPTVSSHSPNPLNTDLPIIPSNPSLRKSTRVSKPPSYLKDFKCSNVITDQLPHSNRAIKSSSASHTSGTKYPLSQFLGSSTLSPSYAHFCSLITAFP